MTTTGLTRIVNQAAGERTLNRLRMNPSRKAGRGLLWVPDGPRVEVDYAIDDSIRHHADVLGV